MKSSEAFARVEKLESALAGAMRAGDKQTDELARLSRLNARQRSAMWRAFHLIKRGKYSAAAAVMETECREPRHRSRRNDRDSVAP